jgi:zinc-binding in reverse transcriptase
MLCVMKNLKFLLFLMLYSFLKIMTPPYGFGSLLIVIQLSLCIIFMFWGITIPLPQSVWTLRIPLKHKLFFWMALHNEILTRDNLPKKDWTGNS